MAGHLLLEHGEDDSLVGVYTGMTPEQLDEIREALGLPARSRPRR
jgi:hypothetical protein